MHQVVSNGTTRTFIGPKFFISLTCLRHVLTYLRHLQVITIKK